MLNGEQKKTLSLIVFASALLGAVVLVVLMAGVQTYAG